MPLIASFTRKRESRDFNRLPRVRAFAGATSWQAHSIHSQALRVLVDRVMVLSRQGHGLKLSLGGESGLARTSATIGSCIVPAVPMIVLPSRVASSLLLGSPTMESARAGWPASS